MRKYEVSCERDIQDVCKRNSGQSFIVNQYQKTYVVSDPYYHTHDFYELIYVYRGRGGQYLAGEKDALRMETGDVCLLTPGKIHAMMPSNSIYTGRLRYPFFRSAILSRR